jgi:RND family efflux transporter MFP subunit
MTLSAIPVHESTSRFPWLRWWMWLIALGVAALAGGIYAFATGALAFGGPPPTPVKWHTVTAGPMVVQVHKDGELQAVNNIEVMSLVEGISTIVQIVKEGTVVSQDDLLVELDSSAIKLRIEDTTLDLKRAESDVAAAKNVLQIQQSQNDANLEAAQVDVELAKLSVRQYEEGTHPDEMATAETNLRMARITVANKEDDLKQVRELFAKNFVNLADVKQAELNLETQKNEMNKAASALKVLKDYTHPMMLAGKQSYLKQAEQKLARTKIENQNNLTKATTALETTEATRKIHERRLEHLQEQLKFCTIKAPSAGLVVYNNLSGRSESAPIQEGTQVRERQVLLRLPDTLAMKAVVRINENQVIRLRPDQRGTVKITGLREPVTAAVTRISPVADSSARWTNPDVREYPVELALDWTPPNLKPGMSVQVEIDVDSLQNVITVPLAAIYSAGDDNYVFVRGEKDVPTPRKIEIGVANDTHVQIKNDGLQAGEQVVLLQAGQGRELLEKAGIQPQTAEPAKARKPGGKGKTPAAPKKAPAPPPADAAPAAAKI